MFCRDVKLTTAYPSFDCRHVRGHYIIVYHILSDNQPLSFLMSVLTSVHVSIMHISSTHICSSANRGGAEPWKAGLATKGLASEIFCLRTTNQRVLSNHLSSRQRAVVSQFYLSVLELAKSHRESRWAALTSLAQAVAFEHKALVSVFGCFELLGVMTIDSN